MGRVIDGVSYNNLGQGLVDRPDGVPTSGQLLGLALVAGAGFVLGGETVRLLMRKSAFGVLLVVGGVGLCMKLYKPFSSFVASLYLPRLMRYIDKSLERSKHELMKECHGDCLDFGAGSGHNLRYFVPHKHKIRSITSLEPNKHLHSHIRDWAHKLDLEVDIFPGFSNELLAKVGPNQFDYIFIGNVFCEIPELAPVLEDIHKLLKPNGKMVFFEHVAREQGDLVRTLQQVAHPIWEVLGDGCSCCRDTLQKINNSSFSKENVHAWEVFMPIPFPLINRIHLGIAHKK